MDKHQQQERDRPAYKEFVIKLAKEEEIQVLAKKTELFNTLLESHEKDCTTFKFECRRWGDFLTFFVERYQNDPYWNLVGTKKESISINLGATKTIKLSLGRPPDNHGTVTYTATTDYGKQEQPGLPLSFKQEHWYYIARPNLPNVHYYGVIFDPSEQSGYAPQYNYDSHIDYYTKNYPRARQDDHIIFEGVGKLWVPPGFGEKTHQTILSEIRRGTEWKSLPIA